MISHCFEKLELSVVSRWCYISRTVIHIVTNVCMLRYCVVVQLCGLITHVFTEHFEHNICIFHCNDRFLNLYTLSSQQQWAFKPRTWDKKRPKATDFYSHHIGITTSTSFSELQEYLLYTSSLFYSQYMCLVMFLMMWHALTFSSFGTLSLYKLCWSLSHMHKVIFL